MEMRQETNNEMDLLLRRLGRRQDASASGANHLDADELSEFSENALPGAARARYTEHLAECSQCRRLVVQLSSAAGFAPVVETTTVVEPSGLRKFLASLLSPMVLRYAVPALGLIVVAAIGFVVLRQRERRADFVVQVEPQAPVISPVASPEQAQEPSSQTPSSDLGDRQEKSESSSPTTKAERDTQSKEADAIASPPHAAPAIADVRTEIKPQQAPAPAPKTEAQTVSNTAPSPRAPKATPETATDEWKVEAEGRRQVTQSRTAAAPGSAVAKEPTSDSRKSDDRRADLSSAGAGPAKSTALRRAEKNKDDAETRSVAGRRFRKQRGVWVDTAYDSGQTVNLTRGSEQYRALVADEPAIKSIADQLDGEIIVVWNGRAYRIR